MNVPGTMLVGQARGDQNQSEKVRKSPCRSCSRQAGNRYWRAWLVSAVLVGGVLCLSLLVEIPSFRCGDLAQLLDFIRMQHISRLNRQCCTRLDNKGGGSFNTISNLVSRKGVHGWKLLPAYKQTSLTRSDSCILMRGVMNIEAPASRRLGVLRAASMCPPTQSVGANVNKSSAYDLCVVRNRARPPLPPTHPSLWRRSAPS